jgi:hypothetical protein
MKRRLTTLFAATALAMGAMSGTALAKGPAPVPGPPTHEHTLTTPGNGNVVQIGPPGCRVEQAERGARNFHIRVHSSGPFGDSPVAPVDSDRGGLQVEATYTADMTVVIDGEEVTFHDVPMCPPND